MLRVKGQLKGQGHSCPSSLLLNEYPQARTDDLVKC